ncbi:host-nuclease inhibitor Gam family protein [Rossellomorea marisflavi]|uniref:host-nuclease inhibitor Gam family protein n=1 Tax=Rossellomorea marisflavi TaxID=189381 RepID=UPI003D2EB1A9
MNQLQQNELVEVEGMDEIAHQRFEIKDMDSLNWAFRKISALKAKEKEIKILAASERERISEWEKRELVPIHNSISNFEILISHYHANKLAEDPKAKTISTPYGKSKTRRSKEAADKENEDAILDYVLKEELFEFIKQSVNWAELKKNLKVVEISGEKLVVDANGQLVPGVKVKPESISYSVEVQ